MSRRPRQAILLDRADINDALLRYCRGIDRLDESLVRSAYHEDAVDDRGYRSSTGPELAAYIVATIGERSSRTTHSVTNVLIELDGDVAHVESYYFVYLWRNGDDGEMLDTMAGRYIDRFERRDGQWRIAHRLLVHDWAKTEPSPSSTGLHLEQLRAGRRGRDDAVYER